MNNAMTNPSFHVSRFFCALALFVSFFHVATTSIAKRAAPKPVPPVTLNTIEYSAPLELMGFVVATDTTSHKELWRKRIYTVPVNRALERDVQDVFITSLVIENGTLIITNERGDSYTLDLATRKVTQRK
jgi:hypothetical protein